VSRATQELLADAGQLPAATAFLGEFWETADLPPALVFPFELALEEIFMNVVMHGSSGGQTPVVRLAIEASTASIMLTVADNGPAFDPLSLATPDIEAELEDRRIGGLGVHLVREMMDTVSYVREGEFNQLSMTKNLAPA
jgi:anti-sigma regulatory factor (Ser/Thr protein kinase)